MPGPGAGREVNSVLPAADLHIHSLHSDGLLSPCEIVDRAADRRLTAIAITDHDTVAGVASLLTAAGNRLEAIPAVEMSSTLGRFDIHLLGYYIDHQNDELQSYLEDYRRFRAARARRIIEHLSSDGIILDFDRVCEQAHHGSLGRPHIAEALRQQGYVHSISEAFARFLGGDAPYYEPKMDIPPRRIIEIIRHCHGLPVIAHPAGLLSTGLIYQLIRDGAEGIEVWHPEHNRRQEQEIYELAIKNGLLMTGGSDYHGFPEGSEIGLRGCGKEDLNALKRRYALTASSERS